MAVELERDAGEVDVVVLAALDAVRLDTPDETVDGEAAEVLVEVLQLGVGRAVMHPNDELVADVPHAVVVGVEALDLADGDRRGRR